MNNNKFYKGVEGSNAYITIQNYIFKQVFQNEIESTRNLIMKKLDQELDILCYKCATAIKEEEWKLVKNKYDELVNFKNDLRDTDKFLSMNLKAIRDKFEYIDLPDVLLEFPKFYTGGGIKLSNSDVRGITGVTDQIRDKFEK